MIRPRDVWATTGLALAVILLGGFWLNYCHDPYVRAGAKQEERDVRTNITVSRLAGQSVMREAAFARERDSTARVIAKLRSRVIPRDAIYQSPPEVNDSVYQQLAVRDSLIVALDARHVQDSLQARFWKAQVISYRDSVVPALTSARDNWKRAAGPSYMVTDIAGGAAIGYGVAEKNEAFVVAGVTAIVVPRVVHEVGKVLGKLF